MAFYERILLSCVGNYVHLDQFLHLQKKFFTFFMSSTFRQCPDLEFALKAVTQPETTSSVIHT